MPDERKYVRVYFSIVDDERFVGVVDDVATLGTWLRLLMTADAVWPASADLPRWVKSKPFQTLVAAGVVEERPGGRFRIHGLDSERSMRSEAGRVGGLASGRSRGGSTTVEPTSNERSTKSNLAEQSKAEQRQAEQSNATATVEPVNDDDPLDLYWQLTGSFPSGATKTWLAELAAEFGAKATGNALAAEFATGPRGTVIKRAQNRLRYDAEKTVRAREAKEATRLAEIKRTSGMTDEQAAKAREYLAEITAGAKAMPGPFKPIGGEA